MQERQAISVQNSVQQSRSPLKALQQNQSQDEIRCFNQQSNVGAQQTNAAHHRLLFKTVLSIVMDSLLKNDI